LRVPDNLRRVVALLDHDARAPVSTGEQSPGQFMPRGIVPETTVISPRQFPAFLAVGGTR
jgi:hypothetical protein